MSSNDEEVQNSLSLAVSCGDLEQVEELVERHGLSHSPNSDGGYALLLNATLFGYKEIVKFLLEKGAPVCSKVGQADTPLHFAVWFGDLELIQLLLDRKALIDAIDLQYETPLHIACQRGHTNVVELLLNEGANPNAIRELPAKIKEKFSHLKFDHAAFTSACEKGHKSFGELVNYGAQVDASAAHRRLALSITNLGDLGNIYRNNEEEGYVRPLHVAVQRGLSDIVKLLLISGAHVDAQTREGSTPLLFAAANGHTDVAELLLQHGACANIKDSIGFSPLGLAVTNENMNMVKCLLTGRAVIDDIEPATSPLHIAITMGLKEIVALFLNSGCDASAKDQNGNSLLSYAVTESKIEGKHAETIQLLLDRGADLREAPGLLGETILKGNDVCQTLINNGVDVNAPVDNSSLSMKRARLKVVPRMTSVYQCVKYQYPQNSYGNSSEIPLLDADQSLTPLQFACHLGLKCRTIELLLNNGANIEARQQNGLTPLHIAAARRDEIAVKTLLQFNADIDAQGVSKETALHYAVLGNNTDIVSLLLDNGCDVNIESVDGATAFELAIQIFRLKVRKVPESNPSFVTMHLYLDHQRQVIIKAFEYHLVKLKVAGRYVRAKMMQLVNFDPDLVEFQQKCEEEVGKMKSEALPNEYTLHRFFGRHNNPQYMKNASLVRTLESFDYAKYPLYGNLLSSTLKKSKERIKLVDSGREWLRILLKTRNILNVEMLPIPSVLQLEEIVSYLSKRDLSNLISCGEDLKKQLCQ